MVSKKWRSFILRKRQKEETSVGGGQRGEGMEWGGGTMIGESQKEGKDTVLTTVLGEGNGGEGKGGKKELSCSRRTKGQMGAKAEKPSNRPEKG